jgi:hypothetical protein
VSGGESRSPIWSVKLAIGAVVAAVLVVECVVLVDALRDDNDPGPPAKAAAAARSLELPPVLAASGNFVRSNVRPNGTIRVTQWIRSHTDVDRITLSSYDADPPGGAPVANHLDVVDGGGQVAASDVEVGPDPRVVVFLVPTRVLRLTYTLRGAMDVSGSVPGRALAVPLLDVDYDGQDGPTTLEVTGVEVLNLACTDPVPSAEPRPCGEPDETGWRVTLEGSDRDDRVTAQVDLH